LIAKFKAADDEAALLKVFGEVDSANGRKLYDHYFMNSLNVEMFGEWTAYYSTNPKVTAIAQ